MYQFFQNLDELISSIPAESIISRTIFNDEQVKLIIFGFAPGQELSEHTASMPAIIHILQGEADLIIDKDERNGQQGTCVHMSAHTPHSLKAKSNVLMLLTMLKTGD